MRLRLPAGLNTNLPTFLKRNVFAALGVGALAGVVLYKILFASEPIQAVNPSLKPKEPQQVQAQLKPEQPLQAKVEEHRLKSQQQEGAIRELSDKLTQLATLFTASEDARKTERVQAADREKRLREQAQREVANARKRDETKAATVPAKVDTPKSPPGLPVSSGKQFELRTLMANPNEARLPLPPVGGYEDTAYLPIGCTAQIKSASGILASSLVGQEYFDNYILLTLNNTFHCPMRLGGPGMRPAASGIDVSGCLALGRAKGDLASSRVQIRVEYLSCVLPDGSAYEPQIKAFVLDADGTQGLVGEVHTHDSAKIGKAFIAGAIQEASAAFGLAKSQVVITDRGLGGAQFPGAASQTIIQQIATYWLDQAKALQPTIWVHAGTLGYLVLQQGLPLHGYPVVSLVKGVS